MSKKYWDKKTDTTENKDSWQETYSRDTSVPAKAIQALDTLLGFSGSWMGALSDTYQSTVEEVRNGDSPNSNPIWRVSNLGRYGYPELNFIPYNYRTNAIGSKGGSLIGHPISFSIVGPTAKRGLGTLGSHYWSVGNPTTIVLASTTHTLIDLYGDLSTLVDEGLYFVISETGASRDTTLISDGIIPREEYGQSAHFEIFRVTNISNTSNRIEFDKPIDKFFELPAKPQLEAITLFVPYATRLVAVPESGDKGAEKHFMVISPEHSAYNDLNPIATDANFSPFSKRGYAGQRGHLLPIPIPVKNLSGELEKAPTKADGLGVWRLTNVPAGHGLSGGEIIHITTVNHSPEPFENQTWAENNLLGWFEVIENDGATGLILARNTEINANTGEIFDGEDLFVPDSLINTVSVSFSVHEPVSTVFEGDYNADKVESVRLTNLIDPNWVDRTTKRVNDDTEGTLFGGAPAKADRAVFTTNTDGSTNADAGNLLDLGFRMVLFPAKEDGKGGDAIPDFTRPITSNEVILDPSISEKQTIDIDYSAGTITLSHAPARGGELTPHGIVGLDSNNPRGEVVIFACCVPYSMEKGQTGTGVSVTGGDLSFADHGYEQISYASALGQVVSMQVLTDINPTKFVVEANERIPNTGYFTFTVPDTALPTWEDSWSSRPDKKPHIVAGKGLYKKATLIKVSSTNNGLRYMYEIDGVVTDAPLASDQMVHVAKQNLEFIEPHQDNSYGSAFRSDNVRFAFADIEANPDGSITVFPTATKGPAQELRSLFPLGGSKDWGRVAFDTITQRWIVDSPTHVPSSTNQIGFEVIRGKTYLADSISGTLELNQAVVGITSLTPIDATEPLFLAQMDNIGIDIFRTVDVEPSLHALLFGETIVSKDISWSTVSGEDRILLALRPFDGTKKGWEGVNPTHWMSVLVPVGSSPASVASDINLGANELGFGDIAIPYTTDAINEGRVMITERSVEILPSQYFLRTRVVNGGNPMSFSEDSRMVLTLRSMNPNFPDRWVTFGIKTDALTFTDHRELAAYLNRQLYNTDAVIPSDIKGYIGHQLESAGFFAEELTASKNPYLAGTTAYPQAPALDPTLQNREFPLLFIGDDDTRHPAFGDPTHPDAEKVILMLSGRGVGSGELTTIPPLSFQLPCYKARRHIEVNVLTAVVISSNVLNTVLLEVSEDHGATSLNLINVLQGDFQPFIRICNAFHISPSSPFYTSENLLTQIREEISAAVLNNPPQAALVLAKGATYFGADDGTLSSARFLGSSEIKSFEPDAAQLQRNGLSARNTPSVNPEKYHTEGYRDLSRWVEHIRLFNAVDLTVADQGGWYRSWMAFTNRVVEAYEFASPLSQPTKGSIPTVFVNSNFIDRPLSDRRSMHGYFFKGEIAPNAELEGVFLRSDAVLLHTPSSVSYGSESFLPFDPLDLRPTITVAYEAKPSALASFGDHRNTLSLLQNNTTTRFGSLDSSDLPNSTYMSGGRIELFASDGGRTNPSGIVLGTAVDRFGHLFMTHMEHGVFPTAYQTPRLPKNLDLTTGQPIDLAIPQHLETDEGGVSGVRFSGDTNLWFRNFRPLESNGKFSAFVYHAKTFFSGAFTNFDGGAGLDLLEGGSSIYIDFVNSTYAFYFGGSHTPELIKGSTNSSSQHLMEAFVLLGINKANWEAWQQFTSSDKPYGDRFFEQSFTDDLRIAPMLQGKYLRLFGSKAGNHPNEGVWRITQAPIVKGMVFDYKPLETEPSSEVVAVVALKVERYKAPSDYFEESVLNPPLDIGFLWEIYEDIQLEEQVCVADVVETGGLPTNIPSSVNGITIEPQAVGQNYFPMYLYRNDYVGVAKLNGVLPHVDSLGRTRPTAYLSVDRKVIAAIGSSSTTLKGVIRSWSDDSALADFGEVDNYSFVMDSEGRAKFSYKKRMGLGVIIDGGLGVVHATGFRSTPRASHQTTIGGLVTYGGAYPFTTSSVKTSVKVSNIFDTTEFVDDVYVVSPKGALIFEDARAMGGLGSRLHENLAVSHFNREYTNTPNDALLPYNMGGVVFKGSGSVRYARGYNPLSSSPSSVSGYLGKSNSNGTKGMVVPNYGACFLLPKGPQTTKGFEKSNFRDEPFIEEGTPIDTPIYTFTQGANIRQLVGANPIANGQIVISSVHTHNHTLGTPNAVSGTGDAHEADHGGILQGNVIPRSRKFGSYGNTQTINLMEGMIVENVTNGTFYTVGEIGRIYDGTPSGVGKDDIAIQDTNEMVGGTRPITQGSRILYRTPQTEEVMFDLNPYVGYEGTFIDFAHGFGDRTDTITCGVTISELSNPASSVNLGERPFVRSLNIGNEMRVTANAEFVPIMGEHGVDGGLLPPLFGGDLIENADAIFYSMGHDFRKPNADNGAGDIGKFLYICGTDCFQYTGWWVIVDVIENYQVQIVSDKESALNKFVDVAVVRKWKRNEGRKGEPLTNAGALPLQPRSPRLRIMGNNHFGFLNGGAGFNWFDPNNCSDLTITWSSEGGTTTATLTVPSAFFAGKDLKTIVNDLNADPNYNGTATFAEPNSIFWKFDGSHLNGVGAGFYTEFAAIEVILMYKDASTTVNTTYPSTFRLFTAFGATMHGYFCSNTSVTSNLATKPDPDVEKLGQVGIFSFVGINSTTDIGWGDRNNAALMQGDEDFYSYSAAKGLRWVYSHPLTEENVGSYLHLNKPQTKFFDGDVDGFVKPTDRVGGSPTWVSRYPTDRDDNVGADNYKTDIFRINRCPTTKDMVIGGDCEMYVRGIDESNSPQPFVYSPLGISFGMWQDSVTGRVEGVTLNNYVDGITWYHKPLGRPVEYALQPIAREKIVAVNPSSMASNEILELTPTIAIEEIDHMRDSSSALNQNYFKLRLEGASDLNNFRVPSDALSVGTPLVIRGTGNPSLDGKVAYVVGTDFEGWHSVPASRSPVANIVILRVFIPTLNLLAGTPVALPNAYVTVAEGLRPLSVNGTDLSKPFKLRSASDLTLSSAITPDANNNSARDYQWTPASKWWEKQVPYAYLGWDSASATSTETKKDNPAILRVDLTEAYTQAQQTGAGIGSPNPQKHPKGVRLNRIWVNFGLWGNPAQIGSTEKHGFEILGGYQHLGGVDPYEVQAITFNLKVEMPNAKKDTEDAVEKGRGVLPFGGRAPTMSAVDLDGFTANTDSGSTKSVLDIPLYINREAGDISPNVTDRFRSFGRDKVNADWSVGHPQYGLGIASSNDPTQWSDLTDVVTTTAWVGNATTVGIWGGIDAYAFTPPTGGSTAVELNQLVQASTSVRDSIISVNPFAASVPPALEWDQITDTNGNKKRARSLHKNALTGMTIVHTASLTRPNAVTSPYQDSCPHSFSVALTPVSNLFSSPTIDPSSGVYWDSSFDGFSKGRKLNNVGFSQIISNPFKVGDWLKDAASIYGETSSSMLPEGAKVWLEITIPNTLRTYGTVGSEVECTSNGAWVGQVLCSFEVENADGTAMSFDVNKLVDDE